MNTTVQWIFILIGVAISAGLLWYIVRHLKTLEKQRQEKQRREEHKGQRRQQAIQSVRVLAMSIEQDQVALSEAAIRIHGLLQVLAPELLDRQPYSIFRRMAEETAHMPTHERRSETDRRFIQRLDQQRLELEERHRTEIFEAATAIKRYEFWPLV
jgi:hypothetical protein